MAALYSLLALLNTLSPLAVIALLGLVIFMLVKSKQEVTTKVDIIAENHLHEVSDDLKTIIEVLQRMEVRIGEEFSYIRAKLNGGGRA